MRENHNVCEKECSICEARPPLSCRHNFFKTNRAGSEEHRINRREIIIFAAQQDERRQQNEVNNSKNSKATAVSPEKEPDQTAQPKRKQHRIHDLRLIQNECDRTADHVAMGLADVVHQLEKWKIVANQPDQVREKD